jgi:hypothetical protein
LAADHHLVVASVADLAADLAAADFLVVAQVAAGN